MIVADRTICIGSGLCVTAAPDVFDQDDDGVVEVLAAEPGPDHTGAVRNAARACPVRAIEIEMGEDRSEPV